MLDGCFDVVADAGCGQHAVRAAFTTPIRLVGVTGWLRTQPHAAGAAIGYFGASTGAAAALWAAAEPGADIAAVVSRGGRPDLAGPGLRP